MSIEYLIWASEVRDYEVDYQGIVNNANYFHYFDHARAKYFEFFKINVKNYADKNINIILTETKIVFKNSLTYGNEFYVKSKLLRVSKLKFQFRQSIFLNNSECSTTDCISTVCCINKLTNKPTLLKELDDLKIEGFLSE